MKVSIITVVFNGRDVIGDAIDSVQGQSYESIEHVIIDGGSTDGTISFVLSRMREFDILVSEPDKGLYDAMNKGIHLASGDIIGILNADDFYSSNKVIDQVVRTFHETACDAVYGNLEYVSRHDKDKVLRRWKCSEYKPGGFRYGWHPPHPTFFVRKEVYNRFGEFDDSIIISADFDLMLRFIEKNRVKTAFIDDVLVKMRYGGESTKSLKNMIIGNMNVIKSLKKNNIPVSLFYPFFRLMPKLKQFLPRKNRH